jgi:hypothetical protein
MAPGSVNLGNTTEYTYRMAVMAEDPADLTRECGATRLQQRPAGLLLMLLQAGIPHTIV